MLASRIRRYPENFDPRLLGEVVPFLLWIHSSVTNRNLTLGPEILNLCIGFSGFHASA
jgi:hypothetical protein